VIILNEFESWNFQRKYGNQNENKIMSDLDNRNKAELIKKALKLVDELGSLEEFDAEEIEELMDRAEKLKKDRLWKLT
jgi:hypothetical protein